MRYVSNEELGALRVPSDEYLRWVENALLQKNEACLPAKISMKMQEHVFYNVMPCIVQKENIAGVKVVNRYPDRKPSICGNILLYRLNDGALSAVFDAEYITAVRTGAVAAHSVKCFAKRDFSFIACVGLGAVMSAAIETLVPLYSERNLTIGLLKYKNAHEDFMRKHPYPNVTYRLYGSEEELFAEADVILSGVTYREDDFAPLSCYKEGVLIVPIHTRGFMNCDKAFDKIFVDDYDHVKNFAYYNEFKSCNEVAEYVRGKCAGRSDDKERILCYNIGIALHDVYFASEFLKLL